MVTAVGCSPTFSGFDSRSLLFKFSKMAEIIKKTNKQMFDLIDSRKKKFEVRIEDDCKFNEGDILILKEYDDNGNLTGRELRKKITFILRTKECDFWKKEDIDKYGFTVLSLE
jgi:hypothetical protein